MLLVLHSEDRRSASIFCKLARNGGEGTLFGVVFFQLASLQLRLTSLFALHFNLLAVLLKMLRNQTEVQELTALLGTFGRSVRTFCLVLGKVFGQQNAAFFAVKTSNWFERTIVLVSFSVW